MAFHQNHLPKELRPINIGRTVAEDSCSFPATTTGGSSDYYSPNSAVTHQWVPFCYPATVSDARLISKGYGYSAQSTGPAAWYSHSPVQIGHQGLNCTTVIAYPANSGNWFGAGNAVDHATGALYTQNYSTFFIGSNGADQARSDMGSGEGSRPSSFSRTSSGVGDQTGNVQPTGSASYNNLPDPLAANGVGQVNDETGDDSISGRDIKCLCSFGGKFLPRPSDMKLRYVGGQTRIISVKRHVSFHELVQKMVDMCGKASVIKYQLPDEDLDTLVSVSCPDDHDYMMEEYKTLLDRTSDGSAKLRVFLFSPSERDSSATPQFVDLQDSGRRFSNADLADGSRVGITRKDSNTTDVPTMQIASTPPSSHFCMTPIPPSVQPQQKQLDQYAGEGTFE